mgnify:CR=1 FL=1
MSYTNQQLLTRVQAAVKAITTTGLDESILVPEQRDRFLLAMETRAPMLADVRRITMASFESHIDRLTYTQILDVPAAEGQEFTADVDPDTFTNKLAAVKVRGRTNVSDEAMQDNIAREGFEETLVDAIGAQAGVDLEKLYVQGDTGGSGYLALTDGWLVKAGQQIDDTDYDETDVEDLFESMMLAVDDRFLTDRGQLRFWVPFAIENDYRNVLRERGTDLGDRAQVQDSPVAYKGIPVRTTPAMPGGRALLAHLNNTVYGVWREISIETERKASHDRTDFHVRARTDAHYEDENAAAVATGYTGPA